MYESAVLVDPEAEITIAQVAAELHRFYDAKPWAPTRMDLHGQTLSLRWPGYLLEVARESLPHVVDESEEIARRYAASHAHRDRIARCAVRFSTSGDDDPNMDHFNDYLYVGEAIGRLGRVYRFDQSTCEFLE